MGKIFAPVRKAVQKIEGKGEHAFQKVFGNSRIVQEKRRLDAQHRAIVGGPIFGSPKGGGEDATKVAETVRDPADLFGEKDDRQIAEATAEEAARIAALPPPRPLPDEEEIARQRKKNAARTRSTGRASTILSDEGGDYLGG